MELNSGWTIVYIEGSQVIISKYIIFPSLKFDFVLSNSAHPDETSYYFISVFTVCPFIVSGPQRVENRGQLLKTKRISTYTRYCHPQMDGNCN